MPSGRRLSRGGDRVGWSGTGRDGTGSRHPTPALVYGARARRQLKREARPPDNDSARREYRIGPGAFHASSVH